MKLSNKYETTKLKYLKYTKPTTKLEEEHMSKRIEGGKGGGSCHAVGLGYS